MPSTSFLNVRLLISAAKAFDMPIILSTVGVKLGVNHPTKKSIRSAIPDAVPEIDRSTMDAWEDEAFRKASVRNEPATRDGPEQTSHDAARLRWRAATVTRSWQASRYWR
jgi:nicotinamidase-related amidase